MPKRADDSKCFKSKNNKFQAIISNWKDKNDDKQFLEIWDGDSKLENLNLSKLNKHEKFYNESLFWSMSSTKLAYIAEIKKTRKVSSFFTAATEENLDEKNYEEKYSNDYVDSWGEQNVEKSQSVIAIFDLETHELNVVENLPNDICPLDLTWYKDDGLVFTGLYTKPYRLGLVYCPTRKSELFFYDIKENKCTQVTWSNESIRCPRFSNNYNHLCWLQNQVNGPHFPCSKLMLMEWNDGKKIEVLVDIVKRESEIGFNGIYALSLLDYCWSNDSKRIVLSSQTGHNDRVLSCDIESKVVTILDNGLAEFTSCRCLAMESEWICASFQSYNKKPIIAIARLPQRGNEKEIKWNFSDNRQSELESLIKIDLLKFDPDYVKEKFIHVKFEALLVHQTEKNGCLVVFPHGNKNVII